MPERRNALVLSVAAAFVLAAFSEEPRMSPAGDAQVHMVQPAPAYNSWPMIQALGGKVVCAYSRGSAHTINEGKRGVYARTSADGGKTWGREVPVTNDPSIGEVTIGKGLDENGRMLLWVRRWGARKGHDLYRTVDGSSFEKISSPSFSPMPMQVTDVFRVPGKGLISLWFAGSYSNKTGGHSWGTLTSADNGRTWVQRVVEDDLPKSEWPTEQCAVHLGGGRILAISRSEGGTGCQFQLVSTDGGVTWKRYKTNIGDVCESTPTLMFDAKTGLVFNYYYQRAAKKLKRRVVSADFIFSCPAFWPAPETLAVGSEKRSYDAGNVNGTVCGDTHLLALYTGSKTDTAVFAVSAPAAVTPQRTYVAGFEVASHTATAGVVTVNAPKTVRLNCIMPAPGDRRKIKRAFVSGRTLTRDEMKLGKWQVKGRYEAAITDFEEVRPAYASRDGIETGVGEAIFGQAYRYVAKWSGVNGGVSRPFAGCSNGIFLDACWKTEKDGALFWRHTLGGRRFKDGKITLNVRSDAPWVVEVSADGAGWRQIAEFAKSEKSATVKIPEGVDISVCVRGLGEKSVFVWGYSFEADVSGKPMYLVGRTDLLRKDGSVVKWPGAPVKPYAKGKRIASRNPALRLWTAAAGWKVFPENPLPDESDDAVRLQTAANETECAQLVLAPTVPVKGVKLSVSRMPVCGEVKLPESSVEILKVSYVDVAIPTDSTCAPGMWPDPIERQSSAGCEVAADESMAFWIRVKPPKGTAPGVYKGKLRLVADGFPGETVPFEVEVFGFELPDIMTCQTAFGCRVPHLIRNCRLKTRADRYKMFDAVFRIMGEHHLSVYWPDPDTPLSVEWKNIKDPVNAEPVFNWKEWDASIERAIRDYRINTIRIRGYGLGGGTHKHRIEPEIAGYKGGTPEYEILFEKYYTAVERHLEEKGWLDMAYIYSFDEPGKEDYAFVTNGLAKLKRCAPRIRRMITEQVEPELMDGINLWCPVTSRFHQNPREDAVKRGDTFWWYVCCDPKAPYVTEFIDKAGTEMRVWLWQTWKEKVDGILIWDTLHWAGGRTYRGMAQDCWQDTQSWCDWRAYPYFWGNGDGRFFYPPRSASDPSVKGPVFDPPVETYRLEMLRDGIEDYEYFAILRKLDPGNRLLAVPEDVTASMTGFTRDPAPMMRHREFLAREIVRLLKGSSVRR